VVEQSCPRKRQAQAVVAGMLVGKESEQQAGLAHRRSQCGASGAAFK